MKPPYAIESVPSLSGHANSYRWRSLPRVRRHRASKPQGSSERVLPWQITMDQLIFASLSHTHYWYEVGMLKVPDAVPEGITSTTKMRSEFSFDAVILRVFRIRYRRSRRCFGSPWVGLINAALNHLKLAVVTPGATSILLVPSASSLFLSSSSAGFRTPSFFLFHNSRDLKPTASPLRKLSCTKYLRRMYVSMYVRSHIQQEYGSTG